MEPKLSKLAQLAKARAQRQAAATPSPQPVLEPLGPSTAANRSTKLGALAKARAQNQGILDRFAKSGVGAGPEAKPEVKPEAKPNRLLALAAERKKRALEQSQMEEKSSLAENQKNQSGLQLPTAQSAAQSPAPNPTHAPASSPAPSLALQIAVDRSLLRLPRSEVTLFLFENDPSAKRQRPNTSIFQVLTNHEATPQKIAKAKANFDGPSPDDTVLDAQKQAFQGDFENLSLQDKTPKPKVAAKLTKPFKNIELKSALSTKLAKPHKSFVVIGHVDAGKSTLMGRLLFDLGVVDAKTVNKLVREAEKSGKGSFALAWVMDQTSEERSRGVTVDICATNFETKTTRFTAIDAPGHKDFVPQMISGVSQADLGLLVVDSIAGEFESGFIMDGQTKEHTILAKNFGVDRLCVVVNKMDKENWSESRFNDIKRQMTEYLSEVGYKPSMVDFIPISGLDGTNVVRKDAEKLGWYTGNTLVEYLENVDVPTDGIDEVLASEFNMTITDVFEISNSDFGLSGKVISGTIQAGETIRVSPSDECLQIQSMKLEETPVDFASQGDFVLMRFKSTQLSNGAIEDLAVGDLVLRLDSSVKAASTFTATLHLFNLTKPLLVGTPFVLFRNNCQVPARILKVIEIEGVKKKRMHLVSRQTALVEISVMDRKLPLTKFADNKVLGRVVIRREGITIGAGVVEDVM